MTSPAEAGKGPAPLLAGRVVFVTGGSRGIGAATAELMARHGAAVGINYHSSAERAAEVADRITREGGRAITAQGDVADRDQIDRALKTVRDAFGPVDTLVLNASGHSGGFIPGPLTDQPAADLGPFVTEQLAAVLGPCQAALDDLVRSESGTVILVSSGMARTPVPGFGALSAAKAAADAVARTLAVELGPQGIRVNVVAPGFVATETSTAFVPESVREALAEETPLRRTAVPDDVAGAILLLASGQAGYLTKVTLDVTGGM